MQIERIKGAQAGTRFPDYGDAQWDYFAEPFLNLRKVPVDDLDFISTEYPHTEGR